MWQRTWVPSIPTQLNVEWGKVLLKYPDYAVISLKKKNRANILFLFNDFSVKSTQDEQRFYQDSFWVKKYFMPASLRIWGNAPVNPNESGNQATSHRFPNLVSKYRWPMTTCLTNASPLGILASCSTHAPPTGWNFPSTTCFLRLSKSEG